MKETKDYRFNLLMTPEEGQLLRELSEAEGESAASILRRMIRAAHAEKLGDRKPKAKR